MTVTGALKGTFRALSAPKGPFGAPDDVPYEPFAWPKRSTRIHHDLLTM